MHNITWQQFAIAGFLLLFLNGCKFQLDTPNEEQSLHASIDLLYERNLINPSASRLTLDESFHCLEPATCGPFAPPDAFTEIRFEYDGRVVTRFLEEADIDKTKQLDLFIRQNGQSTWTHSYFPSIELPKLISSSKYISFSEAEVTLNYFDSQMNPIYSFKQWSSNCEGLDLERYLKYEFENGYEKILINPDQLTVPEIPSGCKLMMDANFPTGSIAEGVVSSEYGGQAQFGNHLRAYYREMVSITIIK